MATEGSSSAVIKDSDSPMDDVTKAVGLVAQGKRNVICGEIPTAVNQFQDACKILASHYGETAVECAEAYFCYGQALLELARMETGVLGNALQGVDVEEEEDKDESSEDKEKVEGPPLTEEERYSLRKEVVDAMAEEEKDKSGENGDEKSTAKKEIDSSDDKMEIDDKVSEKKENDDKKKAKTADVELKNKPDGQIVSNEKEGKDKKGNTPKKESEVLKEIDQNVGKDVKVDEKLTVKVGDEHKGKDKNIEEQSKVVDKSKKENVDEKCKTVVDKEKIMDAAPGVLIEKPNDKKSEAVIDKFEEKMDAMSDCATDESIKEKKDTTSDTLKDVEKKKSEEVKDVEKKKSEEVKDVEKKKSEEVKDVEKKSEEMKDVEKKKSEEVKDVEKKKSEEVKDVEKKKNEVKDVEKKKNEEVKDVEKKSEEVKDVEKNKSEEVKDVEKKKSEVKDVKKKSEDMDINEVQTENTDKKSKTEDAAKKDVPVEKSSDEKDEEDGGEKCENAKPCIEADTGVPSSDNPETGEKAAVKSDKEAETSQDEDMEDGEVTAEDEEEGTAEEEGELTAEDEDGEGTSEKKEGEEDPDDVPNLQLAWELLELSKMIYLKQEDKESKLKSAQSYLKLGEVSLETENYEQSVADFKECLTLQEKYLEPTDRLLAETHYQLGLAYGFDKQFDSAMEHYKAAVKVIESKIEQLTKVIEEKATTKGKEPAGPNDPVSNAAQEIKELKEILPDIVSKVEDSEEEKKNHEEMKKMAKAAVGSVFPQSDASSGDASSSLQKTEVKALDVNLIRRKRKPEEGVTEDNDSKKSKQENGSGDKQEIKENGHTEKKLEDTKVKPAEVSEPMATT